MKNELAYHAPNAWERYATARKDIQALAGRLQRVRLSMLDWLGKRGVLQGQE